jgi:uncharacterized membrane protein HdeD (DUF308 family)
MDRALTRSSRLLALQGIAAIVFGVVVLIWPGMTLVGLLALFGAFALVSGVLVLGSGLSLLAQRRDDWVPLVLGGLAGVVVGAVTFLRPGITVLALVYLIAVWAIITGVFEIVAAVDLHGETRGEWWLAIAGALSVLFGALLAIRPGVGALTVLWLIGIYAILAGVARLVFAYRVHNVQAAGRAVARETGGPAVSH